MVELNILYVVKYRQVGYTCRVSYFTSDYVISVNVPVPLSPIQG
jgi:hypothetical protein